jgi:hypothetical protein
MSRVLRLVLVYFRAFPDTVGNSMQHTRDMQRASRELLSDAGILQDAVRGVPGFDVYRNGDLLAGRGIMPNDMIGFAVMVKFPTGGFQVIPDLFAVPPHIAA